MDVTFKKAPLVELIAEVRWLPAGMVVPPQGTLMLAAFDAKVEEFLMRLGAELYQLGFRRSERLTPPGMPALFGQAAVRFRSEDDAKKSILYQAGSTIFSAHAVPPYRSWDKFLPELKMGIQALLKTRPPDQTQTPFVQATLRYLDFFSEELMNNLGLEAFISEVLGFCVALPPAIAQVSSKKPVQGFFQRFRIPFDGGSVTVSVADGKANTPDGVARDGVVLDMTYTTAGSTEPSDTAVLKMFDVAHGVIRQMFMVFTKPIQGLMEPEAQK